MRVSVKDFGGAPVVLAFSDAWHVGTDTEEELTAIRAELRGLGAVLVVLSRRGIWSFRPDDDFDRFAARDDEVESEIARLASRYGVAQAPDGSIPPTVLVVDGKGELRFTHTSRRGSAMRPTLAHALATAGRAMLRPSASSARLSRREWVVTTLVAGLALAFFEGCNDSREAPKPAPSAAPPPPAPAEPAAEEMEMTLNVNGAERTIRADTRVSLLDALRERMGLPGTKKGCDHGQCGACTVLVDDVRVCSCLTLAVMAQKKKITTIEGLANGDTLHPMQAAFAAQDGFQCGYCTPGQIMSAVGLLKENQAHTDDEVREEMSGNICRCGAYPNIVAAVQLGRKGRAEQGT